VTSRSPPFRGCIALEGTSRDARVRVARAFFARGSARRVARHPREVLVPPRVRADESVAALRHSEGARSFFGTESRKGPVRSGRGDARGDARRGSPRGRTRGGHARRAPPRARRRLERLDARRAANPRAAARRHPSGRLGRARGDRDRARARRGRARPPAARAPRPPLRRAARGERREQVLLERHRRRGGRRRGVGCQGGGGGRGGSRARGRRSDADGPPAFQAQRRLELGCVSQTRR
jgi:hypothetical protein